MFEARELKKRFGAIQAVDGISFSIRPGETVGLLGPNGAGKTTTVSMIAGLMSPDSGEVRLQGRTIQSDTDPLKRSIGFVPQDLALFDKLSARQNLALFAALFGMSGAERDRAVDANLDLVGLADRAKDEVGAFSGGMKRRLNIAAALLHGPKLLILDEPTVGVDPQSRNAIFDNLESLKRRGMTLIYTTHYMEEAERLCDRIIIVDHGHVLKDGTLPSIFAELPATNVLTLEIEGEAEAWIAELRAIEGVVSVEAQGGKLSLGLKDLATDSARVLTWFASRGVAVVHLASERASLETVFLHLTGRSLRDA